MEKYLHAGISALANARNKFDYPWFLGHSGAAVLAGYFMLEDNAFSDEIRTAIASHLDEYIAKDTELFEPVNITATQTDTSALLQALSECVCIQSTTGHGVIFGTLALRAVTIEPALLTQYVVDGLTSLLRDCLNDVPHRHYGIDDYQAASVDYSAMKRFTSAREAADYALGLHDTVYADQQLGQHFYFLMGDLLHSITYVHALIELEGLGYDAMVSEGLEALSRHIFLSSRRHEHLQPVVATQQLNPMELAFWQRPLEEPHQIKLAYSVLALTRSYAPSRQQAIFKSLSKYWSVYP